jgi:hypothetical protein
LKRILSSSITASAVCLFLLDKQFYDVFTKTSRTNEINELILNCSQSIPSTIDRDTVESEKQFLPYLSNPLFIETMSDYVFTAINVIQYELDFYCLIIGTSKIFSLFLFLIYFIQVLVVCSRHLLIGHLKRIHSKN